MLNNKNIFHGQIWRQLQLRRENFPHALLFHGPAGVGKAAFAEALASGLLCEQSTPHGAGCGICPACHWLSQGNHPDYRRLRPAALAPEENANDKKKLSREITIDQVRALEDFLHVGAHRQGRRIVVIDPAEAMNRNTANALLKALEEPGPGTVFLLVTHRFESLLPTIRSRCQHVGMPIPESTVALAWMVQQGVADAAQWLALAGGAPLAAATLANDRAGRGLLERLQSHLSLGRGISPVLAASDLETALKTIDAVNDLHPLRRLIDWAQRWVADLALLKAKLPARYHLASRDALNRLAATTSIDKLAKFQSITNDFKKLSEHTLNTKLFLEEFLIRYRQTFDGEKTYGR